MLNMTHNGTIIYNNDNYSTNYFRYKEVQSVFSDDGYVQIVYSLLKETKLTAILNICQTIFVCIMLTGAVLLFEYDARTLVLEPLEVMIEIVDTVARDPINAKNVENLQTGVKAAMLDKNNSKTFKNNTTFANRTLKENQANNDKNEESYEVSVIKAAIIKISALLAIGFGEAGGEIIKKNLTSGQDLNPRLRGKKKTAIFGFCDIRQFEEINLALEEKTILLINEIADIIHSSVDRFGGATNKNIGESFLNVWKFYNETPVRDADGNVTMERKDNLLEIDPTNPMVEITADESVCACLRCIKKINKSYNILAYGKNEEILKRIPNFKLNMGFGLHIGYGIEGAVGSTYKIDASYLSPNVNIAARLETATRQFGLSLLVSGPLYKLLSEDMKRRMRFVDCVNVKGSVIPLDLYTIDVNLDLKPQEKKISIMSPKDKRKRYQDKKELFQREIEMVKSVTNIIFEKDSYIELTRTKKTEEFYHEWEEGVKFYKNGYFKQAAQQYEKCLKIDPDDGPAKTLLTYIKNRNYKKPEGWKGVRELTSK
jgi:class 3 adenylate cyclase